MGSQTTDEALFREFLKGRKAALGELAHRYEPHLLGLAAGFLGSQHDLAKDVVQETWIRVIRFGGQFNGNSSFKTWLYRIVINRCHDMSKSLRNISCLEGSSIEDQSANEIDSPAETALRAEENHLLHAALEKLGLDKKMVLLLCYHQGLNHEEAAEILNVPIGTLKSRLHAALTELRSRLRPEMNS